MMRVRLYRWLHAPVLTGWPALLCGLVVIGLPTLVRAAVSAELTGCEFTPYLPFVLAAAILLRWWQTAGLSVMAVAIMGGLFDGSLLHPKPCFISAATIFLAASAMMIGAAILLRHLVAAMKNPAHDESAGGIVFSLENGEVWASWYGHGAPMR